MDDLDELKADRAAITEGMEMTKLLEEVFDLVIDIQDACFVYQRLGSTKNTTVETLDAAYEAIDLCEQALVDCLQRIKEGS